MKTDRLFVQFGCGHSNPENWINYDSSPTLRFEQLPIIGKIVSKNNNRFPRGIRYGDIVKGLPLEDNSCDGIYCSHVLEHLSLDELRIALKNSYKLLKPQGIFRMVLPDLEVFVASYINATEDLASHKFMSHTMLGMESRPVGLWNFVISYFGNSRHLWMWDFKGLSHELKNCGFVAIRRASFNDSDELMFKLVEDTDRFKNALAIECRKD